MGKLKRAKLRRSSQSNRIRYKLARDPMKRLFYKVSDRDIELQRIRVKQPTRREFLLRAGMAFSAMTVATTRADVKSETPQQASPSQPNSDIKPFEFKNEPSRQRKSFYDLTDDEIKDLCLAVGYMRNGSKDKPLSLSDPLQWDQYVLMHAHHCTEVGSGPEQVHWSWFFLPWHRAYLYFLERMLANILNKLGRDGSKFAIPYWDWISHKEIPNTKERVEQAKRSPLFGYDLDPKRESMVGPDGLDVGGVAFDNLALWNGYRGPTVDKPEMDPNHEVSFDSKEHVEETILFMSQAYVQDYLLALPFEMFAGASTTSQETGMGALEHYPHNNGHDWVGSRFGKNRDMGSLRYAALDPIFFMHHANIDRIWSWYRRPQPDPETSEWGKKAYTFRDIDGSQLSVTVRDIVKSMTNVTYLPPATTTKQVSAFFAQLSTGPIKAPTKKSETIAEKGETLTAKPLTLKAALTPQAKALFSSGPKSEGNPLFVLEIETGPISFPEKFAIKLFANKTDADGTTSIKDSHYIGRISALDSDGRRGEEGTEIAHRFVVILGRKDCNFLKVVSPNQPFSLTLAPVGSLKDFRITVKRITLTTISDSP
jgi:polyphenol oxidase